MNRLRAFGVLVLTFAPLTAHAFDFYVHGYLRNRTVYYHDLDTQTGNPSVNQGGLGDNDLVGSVLFQQERLRLDPVAKLNDNISIHAQIDLLDNVIAGTTEVNKLDFQSPLVGTIQLPGAGGAIGVNGGEAGPNKVINVRRAWIDILTPAGKFRLGRQASQWGLGIFQNDGNDPLWGDFGDSFDRILYLTSFDSDKAGTFNLGLLTDFVFTNQGDPRIGGMGQAITGMGQNMYQFAGLFLYEKGGFKVGTFGGLRYRNGTLNATTTDARSVLTDTSGNPVLDANGNLQLGPLQPAGRDGNTRLGFADLYASYVNDTYRFALEYILLFGTLTTGVALDAIPFNNLPAGAYGPITLAPDSDVMVNMGAFEAEGKYGFGSWGFQAGYAQGDAAPLSSKITQFGFRPDYNVALLLFHTPLGTSPRVSQVNGNGSGSRVLVGAVPITGNYVNNAIYTTAGYWHNIPLHKIVPTASQTKAGLKFITAWAATTTFALDFSEMTGVAGLPNIQNNGRYYGWEVDGNFQSRFFDEVLLVDLTGAFFMPGSAFDIDTDVFDPRNIANLNVIKTDSADWVWGARLSIIAEF